MPGSNRPLIYTPDFDDLVELCARVGEQLLPALPLEQFRAQLHYFAATAENSTLELFAAAISQWAAEEKRLIEQDEEEPK